jgi:glutamyl-tRNA(Gln) amidotransferase subunit E
MYDFIFKPFEEMTPEDYAGIGFMSGLEVHQQLLTKRKLFCRCAAGSYSDDFHAEILRHMRPTLSELGEYDGTALMEFKTKKDIIYRINKNTVCTYEMDDTPPFMMDDQAMDIALEISLLAGLSLVDELHIARQQYLDGSIPTGFQRTTICGVNGSVPYNNREISIIQLGLEEDSCREVSDIGHKRIYKADRLGMPLIELVTGPDMKTPQEVEEVGNILRKMMRTTQHVRRGAGATRADTNVSVAGGTRIEIKGVARTGLMPMLTYSEAMRQYNLLRLREELKGRGITSDTFESESMDVTKVLRKTLFSPIGDAVRAGNCAKVVKLNGWSSLLRWETQIETMFSREISDRVRVIACLTQLPNIIHSDSPSETISGAEWREVKKSIGATADDTVVIVWGSEKDSATATKEVAIRAKEATIGIPSETRQALRDGTTGFERILPGPERMYPDTDLPPISIAPERVAKIKAALPIQYWERVRQLNSLGVPPDCIDGLAISHLIDLFDEAVNSMGLSPQLAAIALQRYPRRLKRKGWKVEDLRVEAIREILLAVKDERITPDGIFEYMRQLRDKGFDPESVPARMKQDELQPFLEDAKQQVISNGYYDRNNVQTLTLDLVMDKVRGRIPGAEVAEFVARHFDQEAK